MTLIAEDARGHAVLASEMLASLTRLEERLEGLTEEQHLEMVVSGGFTRVNKDMQWSAEIALAHAVTAIAMKLTEEPGRSVTPPGYDGDPPGAGWQE